MIHQCFGVYASGRIVGNGVYSENLEEHIAYNLLNRPGRALIVDGVVRNRGYLDQTKIDVALIRIMQLQYIDKDTKPYA